MPEFILKVSKSELRANVHCPKLSQGGMIGMCITTTSMPFHADTANDNDRAFEIIFNHVF